MNAQSCLTVTPWTVALQAPLSMEEYWNGLPFPGPDDLSNPGTKPMSCVSCIGRQILYHCSIWEAHKMIQPCGKQFDSFSKS